MKGNYLLFGGGSHFNGGAFDLHGSYESIDEAKAAFEKFKALAERAESDIKRVPAQIFDLATGLIVEYALGGEWRGDSGTLYAVNRALSPLLREEPNVGEILRRQK